MHEVSLMRNLMEKITDISKQQGEKKVVGIKVKLGALSHMSPEHFKDHFDMISKGSVAEGARIETEELSDIHHKNAQEVILESVEVES